MNEPNVDKQRIAELEAKVFLNEDRVIKAKAFNMLLLQQRFENAALIACSQDMMVRKEEFLEYAARAYDEYKEKYEARVAIGRMVNNGEIAMAK